VFGGYLLQLQNENKKNKTKKEKGQNHALSIEKSMNLINLDKDMWCNHFGLEMVFGGITNRINFWDCLKLNRMKSK
jgi:hypothetical protein